MAYADFFSGLQDTYTKTIAAVTAEKQDATDALADIGVQIQAAHDAGVIEGKAMIQLPASGDPAVIYTQAQMDTAVTNGKKQQKDQDDTTQAAVVADLNSKMADLQAKLDASVADKAQALKDLQAKLDATIADLNAKELAMKSKVDAAMDEFGANLAPQT